MFRNATLACLTEIGGLATSPDYDRKFVFLFEFVVDATMKMIPFSNELGRRFLIADIAKLYHSSSNEEQKFIQNLAIFLTTFLSTHLKVDRANPDCREPGESRSVADGVQVFAEDFAG